MTYLPQRNQNLALSPHVVMTTNDNSTQASSSSGKQRNLTGLDRSVQKCEINQMLGGQRHSPKQHRSKRLTNGSDYSRFWSVLPAEGRLSWHFCSCWLCEDHKGDLSRCWAPRATRVNWSSEHKVTAERSVQGCHQPCLTHRTLTGACSGIKMPQPEDPKLI